MSHPRARVLALLVLPIAVALGGGVAPAAAATPVPFSDSSAQGYLGFCDANNHQVTSGDTGAAPFAVKAVSSVPAPAGFAAPAGRATLYVYQPRKDVDPVDWSGKQLTAATKFSSTAHPMAEGIGRDPALVDFVSVFPPKWDGLVQFRMYFTGLNRPQHSDPYPATVVQVTGTHWAVVGGGTVDCTAGTATSVERVALPASVLTQTARATPTVAATGSAAHSSGSPASGSSGTTSASSSGVGAGSTSAVSGAKQSGSSGSGGLAVALVVIAALAAAAAAVVIVRRRRVN